MNDQPSTTPAARAGGKGSGPTLQLRAATRPTGAQLRYGTTIGRLPGVTYQPDVVVLGGGPILYGRIAEAYRNGPFAALADPTLAPSLNLAPRGSCSAPLTGTLQP